MSRILYFTLTLAILCILFRESNSLSLSPECTTASGSGLKKRLSIVQRMFVVQLCDTELGNLTWSKVHEDQEELKNVDLKVQIDCHEQSGTRNINHNIGNRGDGTIQVDYRLWRSCKKLTISVNLNGKPIKKSPFTLSNVMTDDCNCPQPEETFMSYYRCRPLTSRQEESISRYSNGIDKSTILEAAEALKSQGHAIIQYVIKDNKIYAKNHTSINGFRMFFDRFFKSLARKVQLPDSEFLINLGDWPVVNPRSRGFKDSKNQIFPVFSGCLDDNAKDIIVPTWVMIRYVFNEAVENIMEIDGKSFSQGTWETKSDKLFWRGRDANRERLKLIEIAREHPDIIDAGITNYFFFRDQQEVLGKVPHTSFIDFWKHKYLLNIDGTVAAYRFMALMAGNSLVFKQDSEYVEWFYDGLEPYKHYIPVKRDLSDLVEKVQWAKDNDEQAQQIVQQAREYIRKKLDAESIFCNFYSVIKRFSTLLNYPVEVEEGMDYIENSSSNDCVCPQTARLKTEL